ncbi:unnamed protein product, partial [Prorocentrum cordatum]
PSKCTRVTTDDITDEMMDELGYIVKRSFKYKVTNWHPYFVIGGLAIAITLGTQELQPEVALLGAVAIFAAAGVVSIKQAIASFASTSVIAFALLLPVAKAMEETGLLDRAVLVMLGQPDSFPVALVRMMLPVAFLSACLSNTAIIAMLVPEIISWEVYEVNFFSTTPAAAWLMLVTTIAVLALAPTSTVFVVQQNGAQEGAEVDCVLCTLKKLPGVPSVCLKEEAGCPAKLHGGALLRCEATAAGVVAPRQVRGFEPRAQPQLSLPARERELRNGFGCALVASRRPVSREIPWERDEGKVPSFRPSDVVLIEADHRYLKEFPERWFSAFSVASQIKVAELSYGCGIFLLLLLAIRAITLPELHSSSEGSVIFTTVGATGISNAMKSTGVANLIADVMMSGFQQLGFFGLCASVCIVSGSLSMWISNSANVSIVGSLIVSMVSNLQTEGADNILALAAAFTWILICVAGSCFTTPLGYQTKVIVMPDGKYTFSDFV